MSEFLNTLAEVQRLCIWRRGTRMKHVTDEYMISQGWTKTMDNGDGFKIFAIHHENNDWYCMVDNDKQSIYEFKKQNYHGK